MNPRTLAIFSNRYVRVYLLPDQRDCRQTPVQRKTQNPVFNQGFTYELSHREVLKRTLMLKVQDLNRSTHRHHVIGQVLLPLSDLNLIKGVHIWKRIRPPDQVDYFTTIFFILFPFRAGCWRVKVGKHTMSGLCLSSLLFLIQHEIHLLSANNVETLD